MGNVEKIKAALKATVILRGSKPDQGILTAFSARLAQEEHEQDVMAALEKLAEMDRDPKEPALPAIKTILGMVQGCTIARNNRSAMKKSERLVRWLCPDCGNTTTGFPASNAGLDRRCKSPYKRVNGKRVSLEAGCICGARMEVVYDESQPEGPVRKVELPEWVTR